MRDTVPLRVFISYRREDSAGYAGRLHDSLSSDLSPGQVFMDVGDIEPGADFTTVIADAVAGCHVMLALIGPRWTSAVTAAGTRRLDQPDDYVVAEVAAALERDIRVIPVLIDGAPMPEPTDLPDRIRDLARRNALSLHTASWPTDRQALVAALRRLQPDPAPPARPAADDARTGDATRSTRRDAALAHRPKQWRWAVVAILAILVVVGVVLTRRGSQDDGSSTIQAVTVTPESGPRGTTLTISGGQCPPPPGGKAPNGIYFGLHDPRAKPEDENPSTGGVPLVPGKAWKGQLRIPDGISAGQYFVYAGCFAADDQGPYYQYANGGFDVVDS